MDASVDPLPNTDLRQEPPGVRAPFSQLPGHALQGRRAGCSQGESSLWEPCSQRLSGILNLELQGYYGYLNVKFKKSINSERPGFQLIPENTERKKGSQMYLTHKNGLFPMDNWVVSPKEAPGKAGQLQPLPTMGQVHALLAPPHQPLSAFRDRAAHSSPPGIRHPHRACELLRMDHEGSDGLRGGPNPEQLPPDTISRSHTDLSENMETATATSIKQ